MSAAVTDRRRAFAWLDLGALDRIDMYAPGNVAAGVHHVYTTLCRVAARRYDGEHSGFEASRQELAAVARVSTKTIDRHVAELERLGLVEVDRQTAPNGSSIPSRYALVDPPAEAPRLEVAPPATSSPQEGDTKPVFVSPPTCARPESDKKEEEREREGARASEPDQREQGGENATEQQVVAALTELLAARGEQLTARDRLGIRSAVGAAPDGVDAVAAAERIHRHYGPGGKCENRRIITVAGLFAKELQQSGATPMLEPRAARPGRSRRQAAADVGRSYQPASWKIHDHRPLDPPERRLQKAWEAARAGLRGDGNYAWDAFYEPLRLAGVYVTPVEDAEGAHEQPVIVVEAPDDVIAEVAMDRRMRAIVAWLEEALNEQNILVELSRQANVAAVAA